MRSKRYAIQFKWCRTMSEDRIEREIRRINTYISNVYIEIYPIKNEWIREVVEYSHTGGGKRYRGLLCVLFSTYFGLTPEVALPFAAGIEMIHSYSLVHDDLPSLDNDTIRRGKASHHVVFGEGTAVLAGDSLLTDSFYIMTLTKVSPERIREGIQEISKSAGSNGMSGGQILDIASNNKTTTIEEIHSMKTGAMLCASCITGAILSGVPKSIVEEVRRYGSNFGILFQIVDDILDEIGESVTLGKTVGKDKKANKRTFVQEYGLTKAKAEAERYRVKSIESMNKIRELCKQEGVGVEEDVAKSIEELVERVCNEIR